MRKMKPLTLRYAFEALKNEDDEQNLMITKMCNELEVETVIEMKQKLNAAFEKIKE